MKLSKKYIKLGKIDPQIKKGHQVEYKGYQIKWEGHQFT